MEQSQQVLEWQAEAEKRGEKRVKAEWLLRVLQRRWSAPVPADLEAAIRATDDQGLLDQWLDAALTAPSLDGFRRAVNL